MKIKLENRTARLANLLSTTEKAGKKDVPALEQLRSISNNVDEALRIAIENSDYTPNIRHLIDIYVQAAIAVESCKWLEERIK